MQKSQPNSGYFTQLDALRAIAVIMVIYSHWAGYHNNMWTDDSSWFNGETGVQLFFVISGFLITGILFDETSAAENHKVPIRSVIKIFYIRRFIRIFPAFYATLALTYLLRHPDVRQSIWWHITCLSNFYFAIRGDYFGDVSHFWSLAVEEQFYFIWPLLICFVPLRNVKYLIMGCILFAPVFRCLAYFIFRTNETTVNVLPFASLDALAGGALLAWIQRYPKKETYESYISLIGLTSVLGFLLIKYVLPVSSDYSDSMIVVGRALLVPTLVGLVSMVSRGIGSFTGQLLESRALLYLGKISYGIYLYHFFIPWATVSLFSLVGLDVIEAFGYVAFLTFNIVLLLLISSLSWYLFEKPINNLKQYFPYPKSTDIRITYSLSFNSLRVLFLRK